MNTTAISTELLQAIVDGRQMQVYPAFGGPWTDATTNEALSAMIKDYPCRVKPVTITVNGVECQKPILGKAGTPFRVSIRLIVYGEVTESETVSFTLEGQAGLVFNALIKPFKEMT